MWDSERQIAPLPSVEYQRDVLQSLKVVMKLQKKNTYCNHDSSMGHTIVL